MAAAPSDDDMPQCPLCHTTLGSKNELQLHYLQSCPGYDNTGRCHVINICEYLKNLSCRGFIQIVVKIIILLLLLLLLYNGQ